MYWTQDSTFLSSPYSPIKYAMFLYPFINVNGVTQEISSCSKPVNCEMCVQISSALCPTLSPCLHWGLFCNKPFPPQSKIKSTSGYYMKLHKFWRRLIVKVVNPAIVFECQTVSMILNCYVITGHVDSVLLFKLLLHAKKKLQLYLRNHRTMYSIHNCSVVK